MSARICQLLALFCITTSMGQYRSCAVNFTSVFYLWLRMERFGWDGNYPPKNKKIHDDLMICRAAKNKAENTWRQFIYQHIFITVFLTDTSHNEILSVARRRFTLSVSRLVLCLFRNSNQTTILINNCSCAGGTGTGTGAGAGVSYTTYTGDFTERILTVRQTWAQEPAGYDRTATAYLPDTPATSGKLPVVIDLHGFGGRGTKRWKDIGDQELY